MNFAHAKKSVATGILVAVLTLGLALPAFPAKAATIQELQAQLQVLLAQVQSLQTALQNQTGSAGMCTPFVTNLTIGAQSAEVTRLQNFLIGQGHAIPAGATGYFGTQTQSAVASFQAKHQIAPAVGYFGPLTQAKANSLCVTQTPTPTPDDSNTPDDDTDTDDTTLRGSDAYFTKFDVRSGDNTNLNENQKNISVMDVEFEVEDGDVRISRIDLAFTPHANNGEKDPWDTFNEVSIWDGNERIGRIDASNDNNWDEDAPSKGDYRLRLTGLNWIVREGEEVKLDVKVSTERNIKGAEDGEVWDIFVPDNGIRGLDASRVTLNAGNSADTVTIDIDEAGSDDEIIIKRSNDDPSATTLQLRDNGRSGWVTIFAFDIDTDDSNNDIEVRKLPIWLEVSSSTMNTFVHDVRLNVDGKTYTKKTITDGATGTVLFEFNREDFVIDAGDRITAEVEVDFKQLATEFEGTTIRGGVETAQIIAEGVQDLEGNQLSGGATSETHTLNTHGVIVEPGSMQATVTSVSGSQNDYATFEVQLKITAFEQDVYIPNDVSQAIAYQLEDSSNQEIVATSSAVLSSNAREVGNYHFVPEGETRTFTLEVTYQPNTQLTSARVQLNSVHFASSAVVPHQTWEATPESSYRTPVRTIVD